MYGGRPDEAWQRGWWRIGSRWCRVSREQRNALNRAERYLSSSAFSQSSVKRQLLYEDFSESAADFAVATVNADWNEQALKKALRYSQNLSLSDERVRNQLSYEGFTSEQIEYALTRLPDWFFSFVVEDHKQKGVQRISVFLLISRLSVNWGFFRWLSIKLGSQLSSLPITNKKAYLER